MAGRGSALYTVFLLFIATPAPLYAETDWELYDLVEEIPQNFYEFLGVEQDVSAADIRKAYRKLSLTLHPDKNKDENAETQFRQLVAIYEVLKDEKRRERYNDILVNGLPDWRQSAFYYRRVRKMSNAELGLLLFIILTVGHYAVIWSIYLEKKLDELLSKKKREKRKKTNNKSAEDLKSGAQDKNERSSDHPQWYDILPFKLGLWLYFSVKSFPQFLQDVKQYYEDYRERKSKEVEEALAQAEEEAVQKEKKPKVKKPKSEFPVYAAHSGESVFVPSYDQGVTIEEIEEQMDDWLEDKKSQKKKAPEWTEEDLSQLTRSMVKFPGGTPGRWEKIAHELGRSVADVTSKVKQVKDCVSNTSGLVKFSELKSSSQSAKGLKGAGGAGLSDSIITRREEDTYTPAQEVGEPGEEAEGSLAESSGTEGRPRRRRAAKGPVKSAGGKPEGGEEKPKGRRQRDFDSLALDEDSGDDRKAQDHGPVPEEVWTQNQQKLLELALQQYPRGTAERWDKIAKVVPGKSKEECMIRYKLLAELVQKRKQAKS